MLLVSAAKSGATRRIGAGEDRVHRRRQRERLAADALAAVDERVARAGARNCFSAARRALLAALAAVARRARTSRDGNRQAATVDLPVANSTVPSSDVTTGKAPRRVERAIWSAMRPPQPVRRRRVGDRALPLRLLVRVRIQRQRAHAGLVLRLRRRLHRACRRWRGSRACAASNSVCSSGSAGCSPKGVAELAGWIGSSAPARAGCRTPRVRTRGVLRIARAVERNDACCCRRCRRTGTRTPAPCSRSRSARWPRRVDIDEVEARRRAQAPSSARRAAQEARRTDALACSCQRSTWYSDEVTTR